MSAPGVGAIILDTGRGRVGEVMAAVGGRVLLRPPGGGREWEARGGGLRPAARAPPPPAPRAGAPQRGRPAGGGPGPP
ncbi:hypothetical protein ABZ502_33810, partial [Streptomyces abikoensis]|uniref:hypothetical protein n=1 Tax=Streptomyces abikoensis TaxID=97398 RepID=UPI00340399D3